jgi:hypothetical protein
VPDRIVDRHSGFQVRERVLEVAGIECRHARAIPRTQEKGVVVEGLGKSQELVR